MYWLLSCGKFLYDFILLNEINGVVIMNGCLIGGVLCLSGCENEVGCRKFDSMIG